jgi:hypothetical protein
MSFDRQVYLHAGLVFLGMHKDVCSFKATPTYSTQVCTVSTFYGLEGYLDTLLLIDTQTPGRCGGNLSPNIW